MRKVLLKFKLTILSRRFGKCLIGHCSGRFSVTLLSLPTQATDYIPWRFLYTMCWSRILIMRHCIQCTQSLNYEHYCTHDCNVDSSYGAPFTDPFYTSEKSVKALFTLGINAGKGSRGDWMPTQKGKDSPLYFTHAPLDVTPGDVFLWVTVTVYTFTDNHYPKRNSWAKLQLTFFYFSYLWRAYRNTRQENLHWASHETTW